MVIFYNLGNNLYVNITNACPCDCIFCIRKEADGINPGESLWLQHEPSVQQVISAFDDLHNSKVEEIVFCGFGEPMERAEDVIHLAKYFKSKGTKVRLNTNGLVRLINPSFNMAWLAEIDSVSVSLNADCEEEYLRVTRPRFGAKAFNEMLHFAQTAKKYTNVAFSIVGRSLSPQQVENCRNIASNIGIPLRIR